MKQGAEVEGRCGKFNQWVIDSLVEDDVMVVDFFDKIRGGTFVGGNLSTAIRSKTKRGGAVIWGGIRDMEQIVNIEGLQVYYRGEDPTGIIDYVMTGMNTPCRIGGAVCLPGDVVFATQAGVLFIPPHLVEDSINNAEKSHIRDKFGFTRLREGRYSAAQIDIVWPLFMVEDFIDWVKTSPEGEPYRRLNWDDELKEARENDLNPIIENIV